MAGNLMLCATLAFVNGEEPYKMGGFKPRTARWTARRLKPAQFGPFTGNRYPLRDEAMETCERPQLFVRVFSWLKTFLSRPAHKQRRHHQYHHPVSMPPATTRRGAGPEPLYPQTIEWVRCLPREIRPLHVVKYFPHVANKLYLTWNSPPHFGRCMRELMLDSRGGRQGFPPAVAGELATLFEYHATLAFPTVIDPWDRNYRK